MRNKMSKRKIFKTIWFGAGILFLAWNWLTFQSWNLPNGTFDNNSEVTIREDNDRITFTPVKHQGKIEVIFFQGGMTDPKAYAPLCRDIAERGFTCHLIKMSWRLPQLDYKKASDLFDLSSGQYVIGGHSQGGKMAAQFVYENPDLLKGLFLVGTSHPRDIDLSNLTIPTLKLYAENDGLASVEEVMENRSRLPRNSKLILVKGGNHSQFGYLGQLFMDNDAQIPLEKQQHETLEHLISFLNEIQ